MFRLKDKKQLQFLFIFILLIPWHMTGPKFKKLGSCSTQLCTNFQLLIKSKIPTIEEVLSLSDVVFNMLINVELPTIVSILTFMSRINFVLS